MRYRLFALIVIVSAYVAWSQYTLSKYKAAFNTEKQRAAHIADNYELYKTIMSEMDGQFNRGELLKRRSNLFVTEITRPEATSHLKSGERLFSMTYSTQPDHADARVGLYFSERVLHHYYYVKTDKDNRLLDMFWGKP